MSGTLASFIGYEYPAQLFGISAFLSRETSVIDPLAGAQSIRSPETGTNRDYRLGGGISSIGPGGAFTRGAFGVWYHVAAAPTAAISMAQFGFTAGGGTAQVYHLCVRTDLKLEMYDNGTAFAGSQGTATGTVSATALSAATGYWIWCDVDYPTAGGTVTIRVYVDYDLFYTFSFTSTGGGSSACSTSLFGISGATAGSVNHYVDNAIGVAGTDGSESGGHQWRCAVKLSTVTADGTDNDFTASAGNRFDCVDEATPNGNTDYVSIDSTSAQEQTFQMSDPGAPESPGKFRPFAVEHRISHINFDAGKWAANHQGRAYFQNTLSADTGAVATDPGSAQYSGVPVSPAAFWRTGAAGGRLTHADIADMEMGVRLTADASEAAQWRISAVQAEVLYLPPLVREKVTMRGTMRGVMRGIR